MAEEETLWLAASRFDDRLGSLKRLEALGFIVRSENDLSIAFSHQTVFDYVLARTFVRSTGLLSTYVLERQASMRSEEHTSELQPLMRISYAVFCLKKKKELNTHNTENSTDTNTK